MKTLSDDKLPPTPFSRLSADSSIAFRRECNAGFIGITGDADANSLLGSTPAYFLQP